MNLEHFRRELSQKAISRRPSGAGFAALKRIGAAGQPVISAASPQIVIGMAQARRSSSARFTAHSLQSMIVLISNKEMKHGRGMKDEGSREGHDEAQIMLDAFGSVGATQFDVTWTSCVGTKEGFRRGARFDDLARALSAWLADAAGKQRNLIARPHGPAVTFTQHDDLAPVMLTHLAPSEFLTLQTSPGNFQAWIAMDGAENKDFARRLRKGTRADATASGATRVAGSLNFKDKYAPSFPRVAIDEANLGRKTTTAAIERLGLVAAPKSPALPRSTTNRMQPRAGNRKWPSYARCIEGAPLEGDKSGPDISRGDFVWCMTAINWGWSVDATAARLLEESRKARENGEGYAALTARNASAAVERGRGQPPIYELCAPEQR